MAVSTCDVGEVQMETEIEIVSIRRTMSVV